METPPLVLAAGDMNRTMNRAELSMLNDVIRDRYTQLNREAKRALDIGCTVQFTGKTGKVIPGKVEKINPSSESSPFSRVNIMDVANTLSPFGPRGPPLRALFGVLSLCLAPLAVAEPHAVRFVFLRSSPSGNHTDVTGVVSPIISPLDEYNFQVCRQMINDVMVTGGTQPGLNNVVNGIYRDTNPGPYPFATALGSDSGDHLDDTALIVHPYLAMTSVADSVDGIAGSDNLASLWDQGLKNASDLAFETCCDGTLFGFALPFSQNSSNAAGSVQLVEELRYYLAVSGMVNQTGELWYTACPYTNIPAEPRVNSNFPVEAAVLGSSGSVARGVALSVGALLAFI